NLLDKLKRHLFVKEIAHRVDEDRLRLPPMQGQLQHLWLEGQLEAVLVVCLPHRLEPLCHPFCVTVLAPWTDLGAASNRVPGGLCPLDARSERHQNSFLSKWLAMRSAMSFP